MRFEWEVILQISPEVNEPETIDGYDFFLDEEKRTCVKLNFSTESRTEKHPERLNDSEDADETICRLHIENIKNLLLVRMVYQEFYGQISINILKKDILNRDELKKLRIKVTKSVEAFRELNVTSVKTGNGIGEALAFYNQRAHLESKNDIVLRIASWLEQCESASGEVEKFRILWTAFNTLFTAVADFAGKLDKQEYKNIKFSIGKLISPEEAESIITKQGEKELIEKLISFNIVSDPKHGSFDYSSDLNDAAKAKNPDWLLLLKKAVLCIYGIRNPILHAGPMVDDIEQKAAVARKFLWPVVVKCLHKMAATNMG
jgi:hypothetical protein